MQALVNLAASSTSDPAAAERLARLADIDSWIGAQISADAETVRRAGEAISPGVRPASSVDRRHERSCQLRRLQRQKPRPSTIYPALQPARSRINLLNRHLPLDTRNMSNKPPYKSALRHPQNAQAADPAYAARPVRPRCCPLLRAGRMAENRWPWQRRPHALLGG